MIKSLSIVDNAGNRAEIDFLGSLRYVDKGDGQVLKIVNEWETGVEWEFEGKKIRIFEGDVSISAYLSMDKKYVLTVWKESLRYPAPNNAVVFNLDGSVHKVIKMPDLISDLAKDKGWTKGDEFGSPAWASSPNTGEPQLVMDVSFGLQYFERRIVDPEEGRLGEFIWASRY